MRLWRTDLKDEDRHLIAAYNVASSRYLSNTALHWQIPLYAIPAQVALFIGVVSIEGVTAILLGAAAAVIGVVGAMVMRRVELTARWDRQALDEFEEILLSRHPSMRLMHNWQFRARLRKKPIEAPSRFKRWEARRLPYPPPSAAIMVLVAGVGLAALVIGIKQSVTKSVDAHVRRPHRQLVHIADKTAL